MFEASKTQLLHNLHYVDNDKEDTMTQENAELFRDIRWNQKRNGSLLEGNVSAGSHKRVWWECGRGHEWQAPV